MARNFAFVIEYAVLFETFVNASDEAVEALIPFFNGGFDALQCAREKWEIFVIFVEGNADIFVPRFEKFELCDELEGRADFVIGSPEHVVVEVAFEVTDATGKEAIVVEIVIELGARSDDRAETNVNRADNLGLSPNEDGRFFEKNAVLDITEERGKFVALRRKVIECGAGTDFGVVLTTGTAGDDGVTEIDERSGYDVREENGLF